MLLWLHEKLSKTDALSTLEFYFKIYRSIVKRSENIRRKGLIYCMKKYRGVCVTLASLAVDRALTLRLRVPGFIPDKGMHLGCGFDPWP